MRQKAIGLAVAMIAGAVLAAASGAANVQAQKVARIDVSTRAAVIRYLRSIHVNPKGVVIQRGRHNYAGARCPGKAWTCAGTKHTVVQIAKRGGLNRFACGTAKCVVVQLGSAGIPHRLSAAAHRSSSTSPSPVNTATCIATTGVTQSCTIKQPNATGTNKAVVWMDTAKLTGLTQSAIYSASITQGPASAGNSSNWNLACVHQAVTIDSSRTTNGESVTVTSDAHQNISIQQNSLHGNNTVQGAVKGGTQKKPTYDCNPDSTSPLTQAETLTSYVTGRGSITQKQDTATTGSANVVVDIEQNQNISGGFKGHASGVNSASFEQSSDMEAVANTPQGPVTQIQSSLIPNPPYSGLVGTINQDSSSTSTATASQTETQCEDAFNTHIDTTAPSLHCDTNDADAPGYTVSQTQYGPEGIFTPSTHSAGAGAGRVPFVHKGYGSSTQTGNPGGGDTFTLSQTSTQNTDNGPHNSQQNLVQGDCSSTGGSCTAGQATTVNGTGTEDGWSAPTIGNINIHCPQNQSCIPTPPPAPTFVSGPSDPNPSSSAAFNFTDSATGGVHFLCKIDGTPQTCSSGVAFFQGYGPHTFQVAAADNHGNVSGYVPTTPFSWTNVPPDPTIDTKPTNPATYGTSSFTFSDADPTVHYQCQVDSQAPTWCNSGSITYSGTSVLPSGAHTFKVTAYDTTNTYHSIHTATYSWVITPPDPTISSEPGNPDFFGSSDFTFTDADPTVHYQCQIDSQTATSCNAGSVSYSDLAPGSHTFSVTAYDQNDTYPSSNPATYTWTILPLEVSALGTDGSAAGWACQPGGPIGLTLGADTPNTFGEIDLTDVGGPELDGLAEPTFTTDNYAAGSPRFYIALSNGNSLWGYPPNSHLNGADFAWATNNGNTYQSWAEVQAAESGATVTGVSVIADGDQAAGVTDKISDLTFNGTDFNSGTCPAPPAP